MKIVKDIKCSPVYCKCCEYLDKENGRCGDLNADLGTPDPEKGHQRLAKCIAREVSSTPSQPEVPAVAPASTNPAEVAAGLAVELARLTKSNVSFRFNGMRLVVGPTTRIEVVLDSINQMGLSAPSASC